MYLAFFAMGAFGGLYVPSGISLITVLIRPRDWGKAMGIHELAPNLALILVPFLATAAVAGGSWRMGYIVPAAALGVLGAVYARFGVDSRRRPSYPDVALIREVAPPQAVLSPDVVEQVEVELKYAGYIARQKTEVARMARLEDRRIPARVDYQAIPGLRSEAREQLLVYRPLTLGQAARLSGVTPADVVILMVHLDRGG